MNPEDRSKRELDLDGSQRAAKEDNSVRTGRGRFAGGEDNDAAWKGKLAAASLVDDEDVIGEGVEGDWGGGGRVKDLEAPLGKRLLEVQLRGVKSGVHRRSDKLDDAILTEGDGKRRKARRRWLLEGQGDDHLRPDVLLRLDGNLSLHRLDNAPRHGKT